MPILFGSATNMILSVLVNKFDIEKMRLSLFPTFTAEAAATWSCESNITAESVLSFQGPECAAFYPFALRFPVPLLIDSLTNASAPDSALKHPVGLKLWANGTDVTNSPATVGTTCLLTPTTLPATEAATTSAPTTSPPCKDDPTGRLASIGATCRQAKMFHGCNKALNAIDSRFPPGVYIKSFEVCPVTCNSCPTTAAPTTAAPTTAAPTTAAPTESVPLSQEVSRLNRPLLTCRSSQVALPGPYVAQLSFGRDSSIQMYQVIRMVVSFPLPSARLLFPSPTNQRQGVLRMDCSHSIGASYR